MRSKSRSWLVLAGLMVAVALAATGQAVAQAPASKKLAGKIPASLVIVITAAKAEIKAGTRVVARARRGQRFRVLKTSGSWFMVGFTLNGTTQKGWIYRDHVRVEASQKPDNPRRTALASAGKKFIGEKPGQEWSGNGLKMKFCWCPLGRFTMGSPKNEKDRYDDEDQVSVTLTRGFWLGRYEVTQSQWKSVMKTTPWKGEVFVNEGADFPATYVSWEDAVKFCSELTKQDRLSGKLLADWEYRLQTESQWEYACRAGSKARYGFGDDDTRLGDYGWYVKNAWDVGEKYAHRVGVKIANAWGLHDLHGNVWEWCQDWYTKDLPGGTDPEVSTKAAFRVNRGGSWFYAARRCRSAHRRRFGPGNRFVTLGFRVAAVQVSSK